MADDRVEFELVSPERLLLSEGVEMVVVPGTEGDFGVLPRHTPMISTLRPGVIRVFEKGAAKESIFVAGGFAEVTPERSVEIMGVCRGKTPKSPSVPGTTTISTSSDSKSRSGETSSNSTLSSAMGGSLLYSAQAASAAMRLALSITSSIVPSM